MNPQELYRSGRLTEAIQKLSAELRENPGDTRNRTFLFELLCFAGEYARADKQLDVLGQTGPQSESGALMYRGALYAERQRQDIFERRELPSQPESQEDGASRSGTVNGKPFSHISDADSRIGPKLELFAAGNYLLLPLEHVISIEIPTPSRLRDLIWTPAVVRTTPAFKSADLGEVLLPVLSPFSWRHPDESVRLGRVTVWEQREGDQEAVPYGQKMWLLDDEELPFLELRSLQFNPATVAA